MPEERELEKQLKLVSKTGKYVVGRREVLSSLKGSKLLVWSASANIPKNLLDESKTLAIPAIRFNGNPVELGRACGIPFRVSVIAVKSPGDADLKAFASSADYLVSSTPSGTSLTSLQPAEEAEQPQQKEGEKTEEKAGAKKVRRKSPSAKEKTSPAEEEKEVKVEEGTKRKAKQASKKSTKNKEEGAGEPKESRKAKSAGKKEESDVGKKSKKTKAPPKDSSESGDDDEKEEE